MTAKKKTLIELMLDAGVTPEGINGDFIVCDKTCTDESCADEPCVRPYTSKPSFDKRDDEWSWRHCKPDILILPYFIANWKSTIITKQQFVDAYNEKRKTSVNTDRIDLSSWFREREMNKGVTNIAEDKQVEDIKHCNVVIENNALVDLNLTNGVDKGIASINISAEMNDKTSEFCSENANKTESFEEADKRADNYASLSNVLRRAYDQASSGKGQERHGQDLQFTKQPMQLIQDLCGEGFALGQAMKKMQESQRLPHDAAIRELLGAINYIAGAIIHKEKLQGSK